MAALECNQHIGQLPASGHESIQKRTHCSKPFRARFFYSRQRKASGVRQIKDAVLIALITFGTYAVLWVCESVRNLLFMGANSNLR